MKQSFFGGRKEIWKANLASLNPHSYTLVVLGKKNTTRAKKKRLFFGKIEKREIKPMKTQDWSLKKDKRKLSKNSKIEQGRKREQKAGEKKEIFQDLSNQGKGKGKDVVLTWT